MRPIGKQNRGSLMTKILLGTTMLAGLLISGVAQAADMPLKAPPREAPYYTDWTGFYLFGFGGYSWGKISPHENHLDPVYNPKPKGGGFRFRRRLPLAVRRLGRRRGSRLRLQRREGSPAH